MFDFLMLLVIVAMVLGGWSSLNGTWSICSCRNYRTTRPICETIGKGSGQVSSGNRWFSTCWSIRLKIHISPAIGLLRKSYALGNIDQL